MCFKRLFVLISSDSHQSRIGYFHQLDMFKIRSNNHWTECVGTALLTYPFFWLHKLGYILWLFITLDLVNKYIYMYMVDHCQNAIIFVYIHTFLRGCYIYLYLHYIIFICIVNPPSFPGWLHLFTPPVSKNRRYRAVVEVHVHNRERIGSASEWKVGVLNEYGKPTLSPTFGYWWLIFYAIPIGTCYFMTILYI